MDAKSQQEKIVALAIAYHNLAVELEFNYRSDVSLEVFIIMYPVLIFFHFLILFSL